MQLIGAPSTRKIRHVERFKSAGGAISLLRRKVAGTAADTNGALNVYDDKQGRYRCIAMRFQQTMDDQTFTSYDAVRRWVKEWLVKIQ